jgi:hypothetical protein
LKTSSMAGRPALAKPSLFEGDAVAPRMTGSHDRHALRNAPAPTGAQARLPNSRPAD